MTNITLEKETTFKVIDSIYENCPANSPKRCANSIRFLTEHIVYIVIPKFFFEEFSKEGGFLKDREEYENYVEKCQKKDGAIDILDKGMFTKILRYNLILKEYELKIQRRHKYNALSIMHV